MSQIRKLHVWESPLLHGKAVNDPLVHVVFENHEYSSWYLDPAGLLSIFAYTGEYFQQPGGSMQPETRIIQVIQNGMFAKVWEEVIQLEQPKAVESIESTESVEREGRGSLPVDTFAGEATGGWGDSDIFINSHSGEFALDAIARTEPTHLEPAEVDAPVIRVEEEGEPGTSEVDGHVLVIEPDQRRGNFIYDPTDPYEKLNSQRLFVIPEGNTFFDGEPQSVTEPSKSEE